MSNNLRGRQLGYSPGNVGRPRCLLERSGVALESLAPVPFKSEAGNVTPKARCLEEMLSALMLEFFQTDKKTDAPQGIVELDLRDFL